MSIEPSCSGRKSDEAENTDPRDTCRDYSNYEKANKCKAGEKGGIYLDQDKLQEAWNKLIDTIATELCLYKLLEWMSNKLNKF